MTKVEQIQAELEKAKKFLQSSLDDNEGEAAINFAQKKIAKLEKELEEANSTADQDKADEEAEAAKKAEEEAKEAERQAKLAKKPKNVVPISSDNLENCRETIKQAGFRIQKIAERKASEGPKVERKVSTILADRFVSTISGAVSKEMTLEKVLKIKLAKLVECGKHMEAALRCAREGLGGIEDENSRMLATFKANYAALIHEIEEAQKQAEDSQK